MIFKTYLTLLKFEFRKDWPTKKKLNSTGQGYVPCTAKFSLLADLFVSKAVGRHVLYSE